MAKRNQYILNPDLGVGYTITYDGVEHIHGEVYSGKPPEHRVAFFGQRDAFVKFEDEEGEELPEGGAPD